MTWQEIIAKSTDYLAAKGVPDARVAGECLAARLLHLGRGLLATHAHDEVPDRAREAMRRALQRLVAGEPLQYVLGEWDFRHLTLSCDKRALIPRPETEELVSRVLAYLKSRPDLVNPCIVDVGTGTGAIALSLADEYKAPAQIIATDVSEEAIALAQENAARTKLTDRVKFIIMDGLDEIDEPQCLDIIVSNPPYITSAVCKTLDPRVREFEPRLALDGGVSGLDFYDRYLGDALNLLKSGGAIFFEIGEDQGEALRKLMTDYGFSDIRIEKDFAGHDRYAQGRLA